MASSLALLVPLALAAAVVAAHAGGAPADCFTIRVVDSRTGRGVPLAELRTTHDAVYYTDSAGVVAFREPGLMGRRVFFHVSSPGYEMSADGFGYRGVALDVAAGGTATVKVERTAIAERIARLTGVGIYADSVLAGLPVPLRSPVISGDVMGQDSVHAAVYKGSVHWFWGDTNRPGYPLGQFGTSGATSPLDIDPLKGIDLTYFTDASGFSRPMVPMKGTNPVWVSGVAVVEDGTRLVALYSRVEGLVRAVERGLAVYDDARDLLEPVAQFDAMLPVPLDGHPFLAQAGGATYLMGTHEGVSPVPCARVAPRVAAMRDAASYEYYTCLQPDGTPERDRAGRVVYGWRKGARPPSAEAAKRLVEAGVLRAGEALLQLRDVETGKQVVAHNGSVYWNPYRRRWVMVFNQNGGDASLLGEVWFAEADTPVGPWAYARKVATHPRMDYYNPTQHPFLDADGGRSIYFEGTYVNTFSGHPTPVPRYNYNQLLYRLALDDPRLALPVPVYRLRSGSLRTREALDLPRGAATIEDVAFYAHPAGRVPAGGVPVYAAAGGLTTTPVVGAQPLFAASAAAPDAPGTVPLRGADGKVIARVWPSPHAFVAADFSLAPAAVRAPRAR